MAYDFIALQKTRIYSQYKDKPKAVKWLNIFPFFGNQFSTMLELLAGSYDVRTASGGQLDVVGRIVNQGRDFTADGKVVVDVASFSHVDETDFTSADALSAEYFGDTDAQFSPLTMPYDGFLPDNAYKQALQAKIQKNASHATIDEMIEAVKLVVGEDAKVTLTDNFNMSFSILVEGEVSEYTNFALTTDLITNRPQGVNFLGYVVNLIFFSKLDNDDFDSDEAKNTYYFGDEDAQFSGFTGGST